MRKTFFQEMRATLVLAVPLIIGQASNVGMSFVDTLMAGRLSPQDLAAVAIGATLWNALTLMLIGTLLAVPAFISQFDGAGQRDRMAPFVRQALWLALSIALAVLLLGRHTQGVMQLIGIPDEVIPLADAYLRGITWGAPAMGGYLVLRFFCDGLGRTRPTMFIGLMGMILNIPADYVLMYGKLGFPAMGAQGCGIATAVVLWCQFLVVSLFVVRAQPYRFLNLLRDWEWPRPERLWSIIKVGGPIGAAIFVEASLFVSATLLMGSLGTTAIAGHQIALNFASLMFMVPLGTALAITVRVGNAVGRGEMAEARFRGFAGIGLIIATGVLAAIIILLLRDEIVALYTADPAVSALAVSLLLFAAWFQVPDGVQIASTGALRGLKDTAVPLIIIVLCYWVIGIPTSYTLGIAMGRGGGGIWTGMIVALTIASVFLTLRFHLRTRAYRPVAATRGVD